MSDIRILIVDNSNEFTMLLKRRLGMYNGIKVLPIANNGPEALLLLRNYKVDIVLLDMVMPGMDGLELLRNIRDLGFDPVVIVISALSTNAIVKEALTLGASCYFDKPINCDKLIYKIRKIMRQNVSIQKQT